MAAGLKKLFPSLSFSIPKTTGDVENAPFLPLEQLLPALPHYALVVDLSREAAQGIDVACAALGVPSFGASQLWPDVPVPEPRLGLRRLLTDPGFSEWRRAVAADRLEAAFGDEVVQRFRRAALEGQPAPARSASRRPAAAAVADIELFLVRPVNGAPPDVRDRTGRDPAVDVGLRWDCAHGKAITEGECAFAKSSARNPRVLLEFQGIGRSARIA
jgi:hypothetical protein